MPQKPNRNIGPIPVLWGQVDPALRKLAGMGAGAPSPQPAAGGSGAGKPPPNFPVAQMPMPNPGGFQFNVGQHGTQTGSPGPTPQNSFQSEILRYFRETLQHLGVISNKLNNLGQTTPGPPAPGTQPRTTTPQQQTGLPGAGEHFMKMLRSSTTGSIFGNLAGGLGNLGGMLPGGTGKVLEFIGKFGEEIGKSLDRLRRWSEMLYDANTRFAEFSGAMAGVQARQQVREMQLSRERGDRLAGSTESLAREKFRYDQNNAPIEDAWSRLKADSTAFGLRIINNIQEKLGIKEIGKTVNDILDNLENRDKSKEGIPANEWMYELGQLSAMNQYGRPDRFGP